MAEGEAAIEAGLEGPAATGPQPGARPSPACCLALALVVALCAGGGLWLFDSLNPTHAQNGARVTKEAALGYVLNVRLSEGELQVVASDGRLWLESAPGVLAPLSNLPLAGPYFPQTSISGDYVALPAGLELHVLDTVTLQIRKISGAGASAGASGGDLVAGSRSYEDGVSVFSAKDGALLWEDTQVRGGGCPVLAFGGDLLAVGGIDGRVLVYEAQTGKVVQSLGGGGKAVSAVAFSQDGSKLALANGFAVLVWTVSDWKPALKARAGSVSRLAFSEDGARLAIGDSWGGLEIWDSTGAQLQRFEHDDSLALPADSVRGIAFGQTRVAWCVRDQVYVADLAKSEGR